MLVRTQGQPDGRFGVARVGSRTLRARIKLTAHVPSNRVRNKAKMKPADLVDPANTELRSMLRRAEYVMIAGDDIVRDDDDDVNGGSASDSD